MVDVAVSIDAAQMAAFNKAFAEYSRALRKDSETAPRRAAIQLCKSLRAGTKTAPKYARGSEYEAFKSYADPKHQYVTTKDGRTLRRWHLNRPPRGKAYDVYAENKTDLRQHRLQLVRRGLAKQSWGWVMHNIFNGAAPDTPWQRRKRDQRDPKDVMSGSMSRPWYALIWNRLDYAADALKISLSQAVEKAANWMAHETERRAARF